MEVKFMIEGQCTMDDAKVKPNEMMLEAEIIAVLMNELGISANVYVSNLEIT